MAIAINFKGYDSVFAKRLRDTMDIKKVTQDRLAKLTGLQRQSISHYINGKALPNAETLFIICNHLNIPSDYLLGFTDSTSRDLGYQYIQDKIGLFANAIDTLENFYIQHDLFLLRNPTPCTEFLNYIFTNQYFIANFPEKLRNFVIAKKEDDSPINQTSQSYVSEKTDYARYTLKMIFERMIDDFYNDSYRQTSNVNKPKKKPGRKRKVINRDNVENTQDVLISNESKGDSNGNNREAF